MDMEHKIFEYAVFYQPSKEEAKEGRKPEILIKPDSLLATEVKNALVAISRKIPEEFLDSLDNVKIVVRPFLRRGSSNKTTKKYKEIVANSERIGDSSCVADYLDNINIKPYCTKTPATYYSASTINT